MQTAIQRTAICSVHGFSEMHNNSGVEAVGRFRYQILRTAHQQAQNNAFHSCISSSSVSDSASIINPKPIRHEAQLRWNQTRRPDHRHKHR